MFRHQRAPFRKAAEIVRNANAGIVITPGDVQGLAAAIRELCNQPTLRAEFGKNGRKAAETFFDRDKIASEFIERVNTDPAQMIIIAQFNRITVDRQLENLEREMLLLLVRIGPWRRLGCPCCGSTKGWSGTL